MSTKDFQTNPNEKLLDGARILCVDDDPMSAELLRLALDGHGAQIVVSVSAEAAITLLQSERFDILLSDLSMPPGLDGYDLVHALRKLEELDPGRQETPTVAISGDALRPSKKRRFGDFQVYMSKPFKVQRLLDIIERLLETNGEVVKTGSLGLWEAQVATEAAANATDTAAMAAEAALQATAAAQSVTAAAERAEEAAALAGSKAPRW